MTTTPNFDNLTPPDELISGWQQEAASRKLVVDDRIIKFASLAARWGARHGWEARPLWPEPITDRSPTEADGDEDGRVQRFTVSTGRWHVADWRDIRHGDAWFHAPRWQPRQPSLQEQALALLNGSKIIQPILDDGSFIFKPHEVELIRRALEQAGEGKA